MKYYIMDNCGVVKVCENLAEVFAWADNCTITCNCWVEKR